MRSDDDDAADFEVRELASKLTVAEVLELAVALEERAKVLRRLAAVAFWTMPVKRG